MEALQAVRRTSFENAVVEHCRRNGMGSQHDLGGETLLGAVRGVIAHAGRYGLRREGQIIRFIDLAPMIGVWPGTGTLKLWADEILSDQELAPDLRIALLEHRVRGMQSEEGAA